MDDIKEFAYQFYFKERIPINPWIISKKGVEKNLSKNNFIQFYVVKLLTKKVTPVLINIGVTDYIVLISDFKGVG